VAFTAGVRFGPYEIAARIGAGGMGEVYRATDTNLKRAVALKILPASVEGDPDRIARFQREAELLAALNHSNIAQVYGLERGGGISALVMELVEGPTLADRIAAGALPVDEALAIAKQIAEALEAAHERGIVHRDLKPANIKVRDDGVVKVLDFGLAKAMERPGAAPANVTESPTIMSPVQMTGVGVLLGTAAYMSPEQARGRVADRRSDVWAFGAVLYEMLTGRRAFPGDDLAATLAAVIAQQPDWTALPNATAPSIERLLRRCLEKDPKRRVPDIAVARIEIDDALSAPKDTGPAAVSRDARAAAWRRGAMPWISAAILSAAAASGVTWALTRGTPAPPAPLTRFTIALPPAQAVALSVNDRDLALSPDGSRLVYTAGSEYRLMVRAFDQLADTPLAAVTNARAPFFSPDGRWVAFFDRLDEGIDTGAVRDGALKKVSIAGGAPSVICRVAGGSRGASWVAPDTIVFATGDLKTGLLRVTGAGGEPEVLTVPDAANGERDHLYPSVLPDGRSVLFTITRTRLQDAQVALLDLQTRRYRTIVPRGSNAQYVDTGHLVYVLDGTLWGVRFDLRSLAVVGDPAPIVERLIARSAGGFTLSRQGTLAYMPASGGGARSVIWASRTGREDPVPMPARTYWSVRLAPDDSSLVFFAADFGLWTWDLARVR
jgi:serine/threonine-protein kinase